jgi:predicted aldo/keto reductase-like oxidoreductase
VAALNEEGAFMNRRRFLAAMGGGMVSTIAAGAAGNEVGGGAAAGTAAGGSLTETSGTLPLVQSPGELQGGMLYRQLGSTGQKVSAIGLGGFHVAKPGIKEEETIRLIHAAVDRGITFMDNCWDYNEGQSEIRMGKALADGGKRDKVFLMTKIDGRTKEVAARQIETCLERLKTDHVDLMQHHEILRFDDVDRIFAEGGAMEAVVEAKKAGKVRFIGFTGHKDPHIHLYMLEVAEKHGFHFDTVQMPLNVMDAHFRSFGKMVLPHLVEQNIGVLGMKPFGGADGVILKSKTVQPMECLHYALSLPTSVVITGLDNDAALNQAVEATKTFKPLNEQQMTALLDKTRDAALTGQFEIFKTSAHFDQTAKHADWLGGDSASVQKLAPQNT